MGGWVDRFTTLLRADAHGVVDALGDEALLLRQHLRDAGSELDRKRGELESLEREGKALEEELASLEGRLADLDDDAGLALGAQREDLARFALRKLLAGRRRRRALGERQKALAERISTLAALLAEQEASYADLEQRVRARLQNIERNEASKPTFELDVPVTDEEIDLELLRRRGGAEGAAGGGGAEAAGGGA